MCVPDMQYTAWHIVIIHYSLNGSPFLTAFLSTPFLDKHSDLIIIIPLRYLPTLICSYRWPSSFTIPWQLHFKAFSHCIFEHVYYRRHFLRERFEEVKIRRKSISVNSAYDAGKDWGQEEKGMTEDEMVRWHHRLNEREFEQTPGDGEGQGSLVGCSS